MFLMIVVTLVGGSAAVARDRHIRSSTWLEDGCSGAAAKLARFGALCTAAVFLCWAPSACAWSGTRSATRRPRPPSACRPGGIRSGCRCCRRRSPDALRAVPAQRAAPGSTERRPMIAALLFVLFIALMLTGRADRRGAGARRLGWPSGWPTLDNAEVRPAGRAAELLRGAGQVSAAGHSDVRAGRLHLRPLGRRAAAGELRRRHRRARAGMLPLVAIAVAMFLGGISGSGPANAAAVGGVMIGAMSRAGYPPAFSASVIGAAAATDILIPPSIAFIVYSVMVPGASVPALFAAGMMPGMLAGIALIVPAVSMSRKHKMGAPRPRCRSRRSGPACARRSWGLAAPFADSRRHARRLVHADRSRRDGGVLRAVRRHGRSIARSPCATCS